MEVLGLRAARGAQETVRVKNIWIPIAIGSVVLGTLGAVLLADKKRRFQAPKSIALIGDSYAVGLGPELAKIFPTFKYSGVVGTNTSQWAKHSAACGTCGDWLTAFKPDVALVSLGVNDGSTPNPANYQRIVQGLQKIGARVVWIEPPALVQTAARKVISELGVSTVPGPSFPLGDGLHPDAIGYQIWAREIAKEIQS